MSVTWSSPVVTKCVTITSALDVSCTEGYCLYGTLLLHPCSACPIQIRAHHHIDVYIDINNNNNKLTEDHQHNYKMKFWKKMSRKS